MRNRNVSYTEWTLWELAPPQENTGSATEMIHLNDIASNSKATKNKFKSTTWPSDRDLGKKQFWLMASMSALEIKALRVTRTRVWIEKLIDSTSQDLILGNMSTWMTKLSNFFNKNIKLNFVQKSKLNIVTKWNFALNSAGKHFSFQRACFVYIF